MAQPGGEAAPDGQGSPYLESDLPDVSGIPLDALLDPDNPALDAAAAEIQRRMREQPGVDVTEWPRE